MHLLLSIRLVSLTAGTLLAFFWMVVILGHRRQRNFERIFFFLCLALVCFFGCSLLALNAQLYYATPTEGLVKFAWTVLCLGLWFVPSLVLHLHVEYATVREILRSALARRVWLAVCYGPALLLLPWLFLALTHLPGESAFAHPTQALGLPFQVWFAVALVLSMYWQSKFLRAAPDPEQRRFHSVIRFFLACVTVSFLCLPILQPRYPQSAGALASVLVIVFALAPFAILIGNVRRFNFLQIGRQRNLMYAVFLTFVALLYLSFVRRASLWLDPYLPPEASAALLLFLPVAFFEPLQRTMRRLLQQTAQAELDHAHKLIGPIYDMARRGDVEKLVAFSGRWIAEQLQLAEVNLVLRSGDEVPAFLKQPLKASEESFEIRRGGEALGTLRVRSHGAMISGETDAALELLCEQLPAAIDLCRSIAEKLQLERELAERERLALVGQTAASISHNLKNPLGSIKTILQVQLENPELPAAMRPETQMVLDEIGRLSAKLNQLLEFSRPGMRSGSVVCCDLAQVTTEVVEVFLREAGEKGIALDWSAPSAPCAVAASNDGLNDIVSNVVLNAIEATDRGGRVRVTLQQLGGSYQLNVEDDGMGIPAAVQTKILQPFFTTKARGTGLGLAIVQRRLEEIGGTIEAVSPARDSRGTRFSLRFPVATNGVPR